MVDKKFMELLSSDPKVKAEVLKACSEAIAKVAEAHGFKSDAVQELSEDELKLAAGGGTICPATSPLPGYWDGSPY